MAIDSISLASGQELILGAYMKNRIVTYGGSSLHVDYGEKACGY